MIGLRAVVGALLLGCSGYATAQQATLAPSAALACLTPPADENKAPAYPPELIERKEGGTVEVEMTFDHPTNPPRVKVLNAKETFAKLEDVVVRHVRQFRVPCLKPGEALAVLRQHYVFVPNDGRKVMAAAPTDEADARRSQLMDCWVNKAGDKRPAYSASARRHGEQGSVLAIVEFSAPDAPPKVEIVAAPAGSLSLVAAVKSFAEDLRLPCLPPGETLASRYIFRYLLDGADRTVLRDTDLLTFLRSARDVPRPAYFDMASMGCPFTVRIQYSRPYFGNKVEEVDEHNPARQPLLNWLSKIELKLSQRVSEQVLGTWMDVAVPCGKIDL
ncbi:MAG TPA: hypothetical protein VEZ89_17595 [Rubrivivax sp.]|nr:hypothetical protein [Rubrivivax sp.]